MNTQRTRTLGRRLASDSVATTAAALLAAAPSASAAPNPTGQVKGLAGKCIDVQSSGTANGTPIQSYDCNGTAAQQWIHTPGQDLVNPQANKCLDVANNNSANGTRLHIWDCVGVSSQKWTPPAQTPPRRCTSTTIRQATPGSRRCGRTWPR